MLGSLLVPGNNSLSATEQATVVFQSARRSSKWLKHSVINQRRVKRCCSKSEVILPNRMWYENRSTDNVSLS